MKTAYTIIEENRLRTIFLFFLYGVLFAFLGIIIYFITKEFWISTFVIIYAFIYSLLNVFWGDRLLMWLTGAKKINKNEYEDVYRLVENISITAGLPKTPEVYLIDVKDMNAFAVGTIGENYKVVLTKGIIEGLEKDELESVIAHEISHIKNKDTKLMTWAVILAGAIAVISDVLLRMSSGSNRESNGRGGLIIFLIILAASILAPIFALLIQFAISRKREFMADSTAVILTRNPEALINALIKVSKSSQKNLQETPQIAALCFINPLKEKSILNKINSLFSTHPPVEERIKLLKGMVL